MKIAYPQDKFEVLVINDGSSDKTGEVTHKMLSQYPNLRILDIDKEESGHGKSAALNKGFTYLTETSQFRDNPNWIVGVFDSDGMPDENMLRKTSYRFNDPRVGAVQVLVRISNSKTSVLTML